MIFNYTFDPNYAKTQIAVLTGNSIGLWKRLMNYSLYRQQYLIIDGNEELVELFRKHTRLPYCRIEVRSKGIVLLFKIGKDLMVLPIPFYSLTVFKGSDYFQFYSGKWRVKLAITQDDPNKLKLVQEILRSKHDSVSELTQYYGNLDV